MDLAHIANCCGPARNASRSDAGGGVLLWQPLSRNKQVEFQNLLKLLENFKCQHFSSWATGLRHCLSTFPPKAGTSSLLMPNKQTRVL